MSKKRKRDQDTEKAATTSPEISRAPAPEKTKKKDRKDKEKKKDRKEKKRQVEEESDIDEEEESRSPEPLNFASLANAESEDEVDHGSSSSSDEGDGTRGGGKEDAMDVDSAPSREDEGKSGDTKQKKSKDKKNDLSTGHKSILSKFEKYRAENPKSKDTEIEEEDVEAEPLHGLEGIPLPPSAPQPKVDPNSALPSYLAHPTSVSIASTPAFSSFNLPPHILTRLEKLSLIHTFPIQSALLPLLLPPLPTEPYSYKPHRDLLVSAPTGSGKTLSYLLPIISSLLSRVIPKTRALIIVPTHELASQVQKTAQSLASGTNLKICTAVGTRSFDSEKEMIVLNETATTGADILIATPGRLVEHIRRNDKFTLRWLQWLVIDEADRLLAQSFQDWLGAVTAELEKPFEDREEPFDVWFLGLKKDRCPADVVKKVVLSATMTRDVGKLAGLKLRRPQLIVADSEGGREVGITTGEDGAMEVDEDASAQTTSKEKKAPKELTSLPAGLEEVYYPIFNISQKPLLLSKLLSTSEITSGILIFTKSNESAARLGRLLELLAAPKSKSKSKKSKAIKWRIAVSTSDIRKRDIAANTTKFKKSEIDILISTDLMSRGVDMPNAQLVINYDSPRSERDYIHRVGRTARAGNSGVAWSLVEDGEKRWWWGCIGKVRRGQEVKKEVPPAVSAEEVERYEACLETLGKEVRGE